MTLSHPCNPDECPNHLVEALQRYVHQGIPPGDFLLAVLRNDLMGAFARADLANIYAMPTIVAYVYNRTPWNCHGSEERVNRWLADQRHGPDPTPPTEEHDPEAA